MPMLKKILRPEVIAIVVTCILVGFRDGFDQVPIAVFTAGCAVTILFLLALILADIVVFLMSLRRGLRYALREANPVTFVRTIFFTSDSE